MASGRTDLVGSYPGGVFIFELKVGGTLEEAFAQIDERGYAVPFRAFPRAVWKIAIIFDPDTRKMSASEARRVAFS